MTAAEDGTVQPEGGDTRTEDRPTPDGRYATARDRVVATVAEMFILGSVWSYLFGWDAIPFLGYRLSFPGPPILWSTLALIGGLGYFSLCEWRFGTTIGKWIIGHRVRAADGTRCSLRATTTRAVLHPWVWYPVVVGPLFVGRTAFTGVLAGYGILWGIALALIWRSPSNQRLGDRLAQTVVVRR